MAALDSMLKPPRKRQPRLEVPKIEIQNSNAESATPGASEFGKKLKTRRLPRTRIEVSAIQIPSTQTETPVAPHVEGSRVVGVATPHVEVEHVSAPDEVRRPRVSEILDLSVHTTERSEPKKTESRRESKKTKDERISGGEVVGSRGSVGGIEKTVQFVLLGTGAVVAGGVLATTAVVALGAMAVSTVIVGTTLFAVKIFAEVGRTIKKKLKSVWKKLTHIGSGGGQGGHDHGQVHGGH